jgi:thioredoxin-related protein
MIMKVKYIKNIIIITSALLMISCGDSANKNTSVSETASSQTIKTVSGKINILFVTQNGCGACEYVKAIMQKNEIKSILANKFNVVFIDISKAGELTKNLETPYGTPTLYFVDSKNEQLIDPMIGGKDESNFKDVLSEAISAYDAKYPAKEK